MNEDKLEVKSSYVAIGYLYVQTTCGLEYSQALLGHVWVSLGLVQASTSICLKDHDQRSGMICLLSFN